MAIYCTVLILGIFCACFGIEIRRLDPLSFVNKLWAFHWYFTAIWIAVFLLYPEATYDSFVFHIRLVMLLRAGLFLSLSLYIVNLFPVKSPYVLLFAAVPGVVPPLYGLMAVPALGLDRLQGSAAIKIIASLFSSYFYVLLYSAVIIAACAVIFSWYRKYAHDRTGTISLIIASAGLVLPVLHVFLINNCHLPPPLRYAALLLTELFPAVPIYLGMRSLQFLRPDLPEAALRTVNQLQESVVILDENFEVVFANAYTKKFTERSAESPEPGLLTNAAKKELAAISKLQGQASKNRSTVAKTWYYVNFARGGGGELMMRSSLSYLRHRTFILSGFILTSRPAKPLRAMTAEFGLSARETEILRYLVNGLQSEAIADILGIAPGTVNNHKHAIFEKTGAANRTDLIRLFREEA